MSRYRFYSFDCTLDPTEEYWFPRFKVEAESLGQAWEYVDCFLPLDEQRLACIHVTKVKVKVEK